ncbi:GNAT family N-acetyltransferase [Nisaea sp.]|uniref:GNAT family N-acetyltransferase n=1 Tax=Nisaea sp. TaxID=2024842 RepID=UPI00326632CA
MEFSVRGLLEKDAERVAQMAAALSAHEGMPPPPFGADDVIRYGFGDQKRFDGIVAEQESELIGYTIFINSFNIGLGTPGVHMLDLYVEHRVRGTGAGRALIGAVAAETIARGGSWVVWQSLPTNSVAIEFYNHIGSRQYQAADFELSGLALNEMATESSWR